MIIAAMRITLRAVLWASRRPVTLLLIVFGSLLVTAVARAAVW